MSRDPEAYLKDILESIDAIEEFSRGMKKKDLETNRMRQSAIIKNSR